MWPHRLHKADLLKVSHVSFKVRLSGLSLASGGVDSSPDLVVRNLPEMLLVNVALVNWALCFSMRFYFASVSMCSSCVFLKFLSLEFCFPLSLLFTSKMVSTALSWSRVSVLDDTYGSQNSSCTDGSSFALGTYRIIYPHSPDLKDDHMTCFCQLNVRGKEARDTSGQQFFVFFLIGNICVWKFPIDTWGLDYNL